MKILNKGKYLWVLPQDSKFRANMLLGWKQRKNDPWIIAENNVVNRIVLGLPVDIPVEYAPVSTVPETFLPYQRQDLDKLTPMVYALNANPMGLGKTAETALVLKNRGIKCALILCPKIVRYQWQSQLQEWAGIDSEVFTDQLVLDDSTVWITNYETLLNEKRRYRFKRFQWPYLIVDEAHKIKNRNSQTSAAVKDIPAAHRMALTGTPILRYADDLYGILNFLSEQYSGISYWNFTNYFCNVEHTEWGNKITGVTEDPSRLAILNQLMSYVSVRNDVKVTKGKIRETVKLPMSDKQKVLYNNEVNLIIDELPDNCTINNGAVLAMRLMQTTSWPGLFIEGEAGPKFEWILEMCQNNPKDKIVVFSNFENTVRALTDYLNKNKVKAVQITGKRSEEENEDAKKKFLSIDKVQVLSGTIKSLGKAYDGLQTVSRLMVFVDRDWSPGNMNQAEDRLNRMGQTGTVGVYYLECAHSFDQHVGKVNLTKSRDIKLALQRCD